MLDKNNKYNIFSQEYIIAIYALWCVVSAMLWVQTENSIIFIISTITPIAVMITLQNPFLVAFMFVIFSFFRIHEVFPVLYNFKIPLILSLGTIVAFMYSYFIKRIQPYWNKDLLYFQLFFIASTIGVVFATNRPEALNYWSSIYVKIWLMVFLISWLTITKDHFKWAMRFIIISGITVALVAIDNKLNMVGLVEGTRVTIGREFGSVLGDPNDLALTLLFPLSFAISTLLGRNISMWDKFIAIIGIISITLAIVYTQSRGGLLGLISVVGVFGYRRVKSKALLITLGLIGMAILFAVAGISGRESGGAAEEGIDESAAGRLYAWKAAFFMALNNPLSGVGLNNFYSNYFFYSDFWDGKNHAVHSTWFGVLAETGILGFTLFILMIKHLIQSILKSITFLSESADLSLKSGTMKVLSEALLAGALSFIVSGTFLTQGFTWPLYILLSLTVALRNFCTKKQEVAR